MARELRDVPDGSDFVQMAHTVESVRARRDGVHLFGLMTST